MGEKKTPSSQEEGWGVGSFSDFGSKASRFMGSFPLVTDQWHPVKTLHESGAAAHSSQPSPATPTL